MAAEAPLDVKTTVLRAAMDELRHAALCAAVVAPLGGEPEAEADLVQPELPRHAGCTAREVALRNMLFVGCLSAAKVQLLRQTLSNLEPFPADAFSPLVASEESSLSIDDLDQLFQQMSE